MKKDVWVLLIGGFALAAFISQTHYVSESKSLKGIESPDSKSTGMKNQEREYFPEGFEGVYLNLGAAKSYMFLEECDGLKYDFLAHLSATNHKIKCVSVDLDDDDILDIAVKIEGEKCKNALCPTYFFLKRDGWYNGLHGPRVLGDGFAVTSAKTKGLRNIIFKSDVMGLCLWHLSNDYDQNYMCTISAPLKKEI